VALDQPGAVVSVDEAGHGLAQLVDGVVQLGPQALVVEGPDPPLGTAVGFGLAEERRVVADAQPADRAEEVGRAILRAPVVPQLQTRGDVGVNRPQRSMTAS
jgi:hypothetical protein